MGGEKYIYIWNFFHFWCYCARMYLLPCLVFLELLLSSKTNQQKMLRICRLSTWHVCVGLTDVSRHSHSMTSLTFISCWNHPWFHLLTKKMSSIFVSITSNENKYLKVKWIETWRKGRLLFFLCGPFEHAGFSCMTCQQKTRPTHSASESGAELRSGCNLCLRLYKYVCGWLWARSDPGNLHLRKISISQMSKWETITICAPLCAPGVTMPSDYYSDCRHDIMISTPDCNL